MITTIKSSRVGALRIVVCDWVSVMDEYFARSCAFFIKDGVSVGYQYIEDEGINGNELHPAFKILFEETLKILESRGVHLSL